MVSAVRRALESRWKGLCTVVVKQPTVNPSNMQTEFTEVTLHENVPCHLSFTSVSEAGREDGVASIQQAAKLFTAPEISIPEGSKIVVDQNGRTESYCMSGLPATYESHQEIALEPFRRWA